MQEEGDALTDKWPVRNPAQPTRPNPQPPKRADVCMDWWMDGWVGLMGWWMDGLHGCAHTTPTNESPPTQT
jgi:hypothetical protein